jgi:hypothetical protein
MLDPRTLSEQASEFSISMSRGLMSNHQPAWMLKATEQCQNNNDEGQAKSRDYTIA